MYSKLPKLVVMSLQSYPLPIKNIYVCPTLSEARREEDGWLSLPWCLVGALPTAAPTDMQRDGNSVCSVFLSPWLKCRMRAQIIQSLSTGPVTFPVQCLAWGCLYLAECSALSHTGHLSASSSGSGRQFFSPYAYGRNSICIRYQSDHIIFFCSSPTDWEKGQGNLKGKNRKQDQQKGQKPFRNSWCQSKQQRWWHSWHTADNKTPAVGRPSAASTRVWQQAPCCSPGSGLCCSHPHSAAGKCMGFIPAPALSPLPGDHGQHGFLGTGRRTCLPGTLAAPLWNVSLGWPCKSRSSLILTWC